MTNTWLVGQEIRLSVNIQVDGADADPGALVFMIRNSHTATVTTYVYGEDAEVVKSDTGDYYVDWLIRAEGDHYWRFENRTTGAARGANEQMFHVANSAFTT